MALEYLENLGRTKEALKMGPLSPVQKVLKEWSEARIAKAIEVLTTGTNSHNGSGSLAQSIGFNPPTGNPLTLEFLMNDYWDYINKGVNGTIAGVGSTYSFSDVAKQPTTSGMNFKESIGQWIKSKGIHPDNGESQEDYDSLIYAIMIMVKRFGITPNHFVDIAFSEEEISDLEDKILDEIMNLL